MVAIAAGLCSAIWRSPAERKALAIGLGVAWLVSSVSAASIMVAKSVSSGAFWWAFGLGTASRLATLVVLMIFSAYNPELSQSALLLSYVFGVLAVLLIEYRHVKLK